MFILFTSLMLAFGVATLVFWYYVATTGLLILNDAELYFLRAAGLFGLLVGALALLITIASFRRSALPTADLLQAADQAAQGDYNIELQESGPLELRSLTRAFNRVVEHFRNQDQAQRKLNVDVARALRATDGTDPERHALVQEDWLRLAQVENGERAIHPEATDLTNLTRETLRALSADAVKRNVAVRAALPEPPVIAEIDPICLAEILGYLTMNSLARLEGGGEVRVDISETREPSGIQLLVMDNGHSLSTVALASLFTSMHPEVSFGTGLEMPLARALARALGGQISATNRTPNGLIVTVTLPFD